ncbi:hypothetical protein Tco_1409039 [Tanacetum coccineum]
MMLLRTATNYGSRRFRVMLQGVLRIRGGGWPVTKGITCVTAKPTVKEAKILVGQNVARAYYGIGTNDKKGKIGHQTRDCRTAIVPNTQRAPIGNQQSIICYESWKTGHFSEDCPKNFRTKYVSLEVCTLGDYCLSSIDPNADELGSFDVIFEEKDLRMCQSYRIPKFFQKICLELPAARQVNVNRLMSLAAALLARLGTFTLDTAKDLRQLKDWGHKTHRDSSILRQKCIPVVESKSCVGADFDVQEGMRTSLVYCDASHNRLGRGFDAKRECHSLRIPPTQEELNMRQSVGLKLLSDYDVRSDIHPGKAKRGLTFLKQILSAQSEAERKRTYQEDLRGMINKLETSRGRNAMLNIEVGFRVLGDFEALIMHESHKSHLHQEDDGRSERTFDVRDMLRACVLDLEKVGLTLTIGRSFRITTVTLPAIKAASLRALKPVEIIKPCGQASGEESYSIVMVRGNSKERLRPCFEEQSFFKGEECDNPEDSSVAISVILDVLQIHHEDRWGHLLDGDLVESDPSEDPSSDHIPPLPAISPFLSSDDDTTDSDTPDTPPSPTHGHPVDHSSSNYFSPDDSARDSSLDLSFEASSDFHSDASSDSSSGHSLSDHSSLDLPSTSAGPSRKRRRSPMTSVPALSPISGALSPVRADLIPSPKRVKDSGYLADVEVDPREISLRDDAIVRVSDEPHLEQDIDPEIQAEIDECIAYADALRDRGIDARVVVEAVDRDETETGVRGPVEEGAVEATYETLGDLVQRFHDHTQAIPVHRIQAIEGVQREQGHRIVGVESAVIALTERIAELERDNRRLRGTMSVESQRVDRLQRGMSRMQRELRQMRRLRFYDRVRVGRLEACARKHMGYRP